MLTSAIPINDELPVINEAKLRFTHKQKSHQAKYKKNEKMSESEIKDGKQKILPEFGSNQGMKPESYFSR